jgi:Pyridoxamine 5'-phosphate oxidase
MASWSELAQEAPGIAAEGQALWERHGLAFLATVRADGSPRLHPVVPVLAGGRAFVVIADTSPKWRDLRNEPRCVLHALPGRRDDEFVLRCRARETPESHPAVRAAAGHVVHDDDHVFELELEQADLGHWEHVGRPDTYAVRQRWTPHGGLRDLPGKPGA